MHRAFNLYINATLAYGLAHSLSSVWSRKTRAYRTTYDEPAKELLVVDKCFLVLVNTGMSPVIWPYFLRRDLIQLECLARGKPVRDYLPADDDT